MNFGKKIKELRQSKNIGQKEINLNQTTISQIENNKIPATVEHVRILADSFDVTFDDLVSDTDWKKPKVKNQKGIVYSILDFKLKLDEYGSIQIDFTLLLIKQVLKKKKRFKINNYECYN